MTPTIPLLVLCPLPQPYLAQIAAAYDVIHAPDAALRAQAIAAHGMRVRAVLTIGPIGLTGAEIAALPALELVCALGAGYEQIDVAAARARGIVVANGAGTNDDCVADHAFGLLIAAVRGIVQLDRACRDGVWRDQIPDYAPSVSGKRLGILGYGLIGQKIARRAGGFDMTVGYHSRHRRDGAAPAWFDSPLALARWCDFLVVATPGGAGTRHLVNEAVLEAIGPQGALVNIARGSVVDTQALARVLRERRLGAAGIDVYESEPHRPEELIALPNIVLTPHVAGRSPEAVQATVTRFLANMQAHFAGRPVLSPV
ncbi:2-hydroxyacid dehydrogenase [Polaromonas sp. C04]|uniref:2-hydroxyacid dehydrogenase n=1 Tax=Polaromonas sp. C04 TaxID=1945857 RepID=UPI000984DE93|nr:2-hydroxyacid dehydrogenase [Polaromonas sp. C04]OOG58140.1 hydroxyacid dehydrogenase [Polaromonas sp. C04]